MRNAETSFKKARNNPEKIRENKINQLPPMGFDLWNHGTAIQCHNHHIIRALKLFRQKDNIKLDRSHVSEAGNIRKESESR